MNKQLATKNDEQQFDPDIAVLAQLADELIGFAGTPYASSRANGLPAAKMLPKRLAQRRRFASMFVPMPTAGSNGKSRSPSIKSSAGRLTASACRAEPSSAISTKMLGRRAARGPKILGNASRKISVRKADSENCPPLVFSSPSVGARIGLGHFLKAYAAGAEDHPGLMPVVLLKSVGSRHRIRPHADAEIRDRRLG